MSDNYFRLEGVEGNVWVKPQGLNSVYVDALGNSGMADEGYEPDAPVRPRYLTFRGKSYVHACNWELVGGEWLPIGYAPNGNEAVTLSIAAMSNASQPGNIRPRGSYKPYAKAPVTFAKAMLLSIQKALTEWSAQPGSRRLLAEAHRDDMERKYTKAVDTETLAAREFDAATVAATKARRALNDAEELIHQMDLDDAAAK